jgi:hypothetical protein
LLIALSAFFAVGFAQSVAALVVGAGVRELVAPPLQVSQVPVPLPWHTADAILDRHAFNHATGALREAVPPEGVQGADALDPRAHQRAKIFP